MVFSAYRASEIDPTDETVYEERAAKEQGYNFILCSYNSKAMNLRHLLNTSASFVTLM
jgi:hypothetical protein